MPRKIRYKDKPCRMCGKVFTPLSSNGKFCPECGPKAKAARIKAWKAQFQAPDPADREFHTCDRLEQVVKCLDCKRPVCKGWCADMQRPDSSGSAKQREKAMAESIERVAHYIRAGATDSFIMRELTLTKRQLAYRKNMARKSGLLPGEK